MSIGRLVSEIRTLKRVLEPADFRSALGTIALRMPQIIQNRNLSPLDKAMSRDIQIRFRGQTLAIPAGSLDGQLAVRSDNATFGAVREMFGNDVYLRAFKFVPMPKMDTVVDLGSNRGFFALIAAKVMKARHVIAVEPTLDYNDAYATIAARNNLVPSQVTRVNKFIGGSDDDQTVSIGGLMETFGISRIDFLKCDVEGAEYHAFANNPDVVKRIANFAMEVHPWCGSTAKLVEFLTSTGMSVMATDQFGHITPVDKAIYLYGSREAQLSPPFYSEGIKAMSPYQ
jgi:Methyltransferase FkbM domain